MHSFAIRALGVLAVSTPFVGPAMAQRGGGRAPVSTANGLAITHFNCASDAVVLFDDAGRPFGAADDSYPGELFAKLTAGDWTQVERSFAWRGQVSWQWKVQDMQGRNGWIDSATLCRYARPRR
jgi:hypothetical protein